MNEVICYYCQRKCRPSTEPKHSHAPYRKYWRCDYHGSVVVKYILPFTEQAYRVLAVSYKDSIYECSFFTKNTFRIDKANPPPRTVETIVTLDFHPDITPENIVNKLPTYILFS